MRRLTLALVLVLAAGCGPLFQAPSVSVKRVDVTAIDFGGLSFEVVFAVANPNILGLDLASLSYQLTVDNHRFVAGGANRALHVPPQGTGELRLPVSFRFVELAEALMSLFQKAVVPYTISTSLGFGTPLGVLTVPIAHSSTFPVPRLPSVSLANATVGSVSAGGADLALALSLFNPNAFPLPLSNLSYQVSLAGATVASGGTGQVRLSPGAASQIAVTAHADFMSAGMGLLRAIQSRSAPIALDGTLDLGGFTLPVHVGTTLQ